MLKATRAVTFDELIDGGVLELGDGYRAKLDELGSGGPLFLRAGCLTDQGFDWASAEFFRDSATTRVQTKLGKPGDTVITTKGNSVGRTGYVPNDAPAFVYSPHLSYWRSKDINRLAPGFLRYWARGPEFAAQLRALAYGTDMAPYLSLVDQRRLRISLPTIARQNALAEILGALDDKITINEDISTSSDHLQFVLFERAIREDDAWHTSLSSVANFVNGRAFTKDATGTGRLVVRIAEINSGPTTSTVYNDIAVPSQHLVLPGDVLFSWSGSLRVVRWYRPEAIINQHIFKVIPRDSIPTWLAYQLVRSKLADFQATAADKATTMGHIQRHHLDEVVSIPSRERLVHLDRMIGPLWLRALEAERESLKLRELRDALLPKLMSGELRIREAEQLVSDAA